MSTVENDLQRPNLTEMGSGGAVYECRIWLCPEPEGGYSVIAPFLPGVVSQGETEDEAIQNVREAFQGALAEYLQTDGKIPWSDKALSEKPHDAKEKWILANA